MASRAEVVGCMAVLSEAYPATRLTREGVELYVSLLGDLPGPALLAATERAVCECRFFPTIAELRDMAFEILDAGRHVSREDAWALVLRIFSGQRVDLTDEVTLRAFEAIGGHAAASGALVKDMTAHRARFMDAFDRLAKQRDRDRHLPPRVAERIALLQAGPGASRLLGDHTEEVTR